MTLTQLIAEFGAYYIAQPANYQRLMKKLHEPSTTEQYMTTVFTDDTVWRASKAHITTIVQAFQTQWTPKGVVSFEPIAIENDHLKVDMEIYPDEVEGTWLGWLADNNQKRSEWPLIRYVVEELVIPQIREDVELNEIYAGVKVAPTNGVPNAAGANMNGLGVRIANGLTAGTINEVALGTVDSTNIFEKVEEFTDSIFGPNARVTMPIFMSVKNERAYHRDKRNTLGPQPSYEKGSTNVDFTPFNVVGLPSMKTSNRIWTTPKANMIRLQKKTNKSNIKIEELKRLVFLLTDWYEGVGFAYNEFVWASDSV